MARAMCHDVATVRIGSMHRQGDCAMTRTAAQLRRRGAGAGQGRPDHAGRRPEHGRGLRGSAAFRARATWTWPARRRRRRSSGWRDTTPSERSRMLLKLADAIEARAEDFIAAEGRNTGKPLALTRSEEIPPMLDQIRFFAGAARVLEGRSAGEYLAGPHLLDPARADRGGRPGDALELPAHDGGLEDRPGPGRRQHGRAQAVGHHPGHRR